MKEVHWEPVAKQDEDDVSLLKVIIMFVLTLILVGVFAWNM